LEQDHDDPRIYMCDTEARDVASKCAEFRDVAVRHVMGCGLPFAYACTGEYRRRKIPTTLAQLGNGTGQSV